MFRGKSSFFQKEKDRVEELIKDQLLLSVLQHLPHLQLTKSEQDDIWEIVAIDISTNFTKSIEEFPLNGLFMKEIFDKLYKNFTHKFQDIGIMMSDDMIKNRIKDRNDFILFEIFKLRNFDLAIMSKLSQERYEASQRKRFDKDQDFDTKKLLDKYSDKKTVVTLDVLEKELEKKNKKLETLVEENKRLLELNHELLK